MAGAIAIALPLVYGWVDGFRKMAFTTGVWPAYTSGFVARDDYLGMHLNYYRIAQFANQSLGERDKVLLVGEHRKMHWQCNVEGADWYDMPRILPFLRGAASVDDLLDAIRAAGFTHIFFNLQEWGWDGGHNPGKK